MSKRSLGILGLLLGLAAAPGLAQRWQPLGPAPIDDAQFTGRAAALAFHPRKKGIYIVGSASGGVWRTKNGGRRWTAQTEDLPAAAIGAVAIDPTNPKVVYAGSGEANYAYHSLYGLGLYKSTDGGKRWVTLATETFAGRTFSRIALSPEDGEMVWAAVARAGGSHKGFEGARHHPKRKGKMGIFRSADGGETWQRLRRGLPKFAASDVDVDIDPVEELRVFASFGDVFGRSKNGVYRSLGGGRYKRLPLGVPGRSIGRITLSIAPSDPDRIYAFVARPTSKETTGGSTPGGASTLGLFRSDDGGDGWTRFNPGNPQSLFGHYYSALAVHPTNPDIFVIGGLNLLISEDGGVSYREITPPHVDLHDAGFDAAGRLVVADDGGVHRSDDLGNTWISRNGRLGTVQFYPGLSIHPSEPGTLLGGTQDNGTNRLSNGRWQMIAGGDGGWNLYRPDDADTFFVEFQGVGNLFRTSDGGSSFAQVASGINLSDRTAFQAPLALDVTDPDHIFYATQRVYESVDNGSNWTAVSADLTGGSPAAIRSLAVAPSDPTVLYAVTNDDRLLASEDSGRNWTLGMEGLAGWPRVMRQIAIDPEDATTAYVADMQFGGGKVHVTRDTGRTWQSIAGDLPDIPVNSVAVFRAGSLDQLFAGTDQGVYRSSDGGDSWQIYGTGLPNVPVLDIVVDEPNGRLVISTLGRGMWTAEL